eukprot:5004010-Alexandrium_andersonii.AAC.1
MPRRMNFPSCSTRNSTSTSSKWAKRLTSPLTRRHPHSRKRSSASEPRYCDVFSFLFDCYWLAISRRSDSAA